MKKSRIVALFIVLVLLLAACAAQTETTETSQTGDAADTSEQESANTEDNVVASEDEGILLAYITHTTTNIYWDTVVKGFEAQCQEEGVDYITYDSNADAGIQLTQVEDCISLGVDALLFSPLDDDTSAAIVAMCKEAGIPIFIVDMGTKEDVDFVVLSDNYGAGRMLGEYGYELYGDDLKPVIITTPLGFELGEKRTNGYADFFEEKGIEAVTYTLEMGFDRADVLKFTEDAIAGVPDMNALYAPNDDGAMGAIEALKAAGMIDQVSVFGFDATDEGLAAVEEGTLTATIAQQPYLFGTDSVKAALKYLRGEEYEKNLDMPCALVTSENIGEYLD